MRSVEFPNIRQLRMFQAVAQLGSLGRAAAMLNRTQPGMTQTLAKLENSFGVELMERRRSGSYLTECGRILQARTERLFSQVELALAEQIVGSPDADRAKLHLIIAKLSSNLASSLIAMAEARTIDAAAGLLGISRPSLTRSIREFELIVGRRLTRHTAHGVVLTPQAAELARRLELAATEIEFAREEILAARGVAQTRISIGAMPQCAATVLIAALNEFLRRQPQARLTLEQKPYNSLLADLRTGRIDFLYGVLRKPDWAHDVDEEPLFANPYALMVRKNHPLTRKRMLRVADLADYDWILPGPGTPRRNAFEHLFRGQRRSPTSNIEMSGFDLQVAMIGSSDRVTIISAQEIQRAASGGAIVSLELPISVPRGADGVVTRTGWRPTAGKLLFLEILRERAQMDGASPSQEPRKRSRVGRRWRDGTTVFTH